MRFWWRFGESHLEGRRRDRIGNVAILRPDPDIGGCDGWIERWLGPSAGPERGQGSPTEHRAVQDLWGSLPPGGRAQDSAVP